MAAIETMEQWKEYYRLRDAFERREINWSERHNIPAHLRKLYELEKPLTASDISHELLYEKFLGIAGLATNGAFVVDDNNREAITLMIQYIRQDEAFLKSNPTYSFNKGLLLHGPVGTGKTLLLRILHDLILNLQFFNIHKDFIDFSCHKSFSTITSNDIVQKFSLDGYLIFEGNADGRKTIHVDLINKPLFIDDMGSEPEAIHFGAKTNILTEVIIRRYEKRSITHITTNLGIDALKKAYDLRAWDRMREMLNDIPLTGTSRRK